MNGGGAIGIERDGGQKMSIPQDYVSVDLETTGLNPKIDKIIEIGNGDRAKWPGWSRSIPL